MKIFLGDQLHIFSAEVSQTVSVPLNGEWCGGQSVGQYAYIYKGISALPPSQTIHLTPPMTLLLHLECRVRERRILHCPDRILLTSVWKIFSLLRQGNSFQLALWIFNPVTWILGTFEVNRTIFT
jgi:hypothetical protein